MTGQLIILGWLVLIFAIIAMTARSMRSDRARRRLFMASDFESGPPAPDQPWPLTRWLYLAGFRSESAATVFVAWTFVLFGLGVVLALLMDRSGMIDRSVATLGAVPGGALEIATPVFYAMPWLVLLVLASIPWIIVRRARRARVQAIEQDLPITLELLSTLAEAGLAFDPALDRVLESQGSVRPLARELRLFRDDVRSGRARIESLRRLVKRVEVTPLSTFVSALVQAEQSGSGIALVLRQQAEDLRNRRREQALEAATALPVKRLVPLFICFMPGIFVWALGPSFYHLLRFFDLFTRNRGLLK